MIDPSDDIPYNPGRGSRMARTMGRGLFVGVLLGGLVGLVLPKAFVAQVSVFFPTVNPNILKTVAKAQKLDASDVNWDKTSAISDAQLLEAATAIVRSRAAVEQSLKDAKISLPVPWAAWQGDAVETFRSNSITVDPSGGAYLKVSVTMSRAESARAVCQGLLDYYTTFVHEHRLTNTARTLQQLEEKLVRVDKRLSVLEKKLSSTSSLRISSMDQTMRPDPKVLRELWKQRILEGGSSGRVLDEMNKIRREAANDQADEPDETRVGEDWRARWGSTTLENPQDSAGGNKNVRHSDLPSRLELERVYEETLLLYHSGLLQFDFLSMWASLENFDFEVVDPISVSVQPTGPRVFQGVCLGGFLGLLLGTLFRRPD